MIIFYLKKEVYIVKHGVHPKPEHIVSLLRQMEVLTVNGKTLEGGSQIPLHDRLKLLSLAQDVRWQTLKEFPLVKVDQAKNLKDLERENVRLKS